MTIIESHVNDKSEFAGQFYFTDYLQNEGRITWSTKY